MRAKEFFHEPVLLEEVLEYLDVKEGQKYIDATLGGGGHTVAILAKGGFVLGIDQDQDAVEWASRRFLNKDQRKKEVGRFWGVSENFRHLDRVAKRYGFVNVAGILFDLGVSSFQLDRSQRGFSFRKDEVLDLRMDVTATQVRALDLVNGLSKRELEKLFRLYGEEPKAYEIAKEIVRHRDAQKIVTTRELREVIKRVGGTGKTMARVWQALRIAVNDEIGALKEALPKAVELLRPGGRLLVISFHSLEDRVVKRTFEEQHLMLRVLTPKPIRPTKAEVERNPRASSARLRVAEKR